MHTGDIMRNFIICLLISSFVLCYIDTAVTDDEAL